MAGVVLFGCSAALSSVVCGTITGGVAWGTRYVSQIPTQCAISAGIVGTTMTGVSTILNKLFFSNELHVNVYDKILREPTKEKPNSVTERVNTMKKAVFIVSMLAMGLGFLASTGIAPIVASLVGRNISYQAAALFSFINIFPTLIANSFTKK